MAGWWKKWRRGEESVGRKPGSGRPMFHCAGRWESARLGRKQSTSPIWTAPAANASGSFRVSPFSLQKGPAGTKLDHTEASLHLLFRLLAR